MSRKKYRSDAVFFQEQGLTVIELAIVASLLSAILALAYTFWYFGFSSFVSAERRSDVQQNVRMATDFIHREVRFSTSVALLDATAVPAIGAIAPDTHYILLNGSAIEYRAKDVSQVIPQNIANNVHFNLTFTTSSDDLLSVVVSGAANNQQHALSSVIRLENLRHFDRVITGTGTPRTAIRFVRRTFNLPTTLFVTPSSVVEGTGSQEFTLTLLNNTFSDSFGTNSITLSDDFTGLAVTSVTKTNPASATVTLSGNLTRDIGSGQIRVESTGLAGGSALSAHVGVLTDTIFTLNILRSGEGNTTPAVGSHPFAQGTSVTLTANSTAPWQFHRWQIDNNTYHIAQRTVSMDSNKTATAFFRRPLTSIPGGSYVSHNGITYLKLTGADNRVMNLSLNGNGVWSNTSSRPSRSELEGGIWTNSLRIAGVNSYWTSDERNNPHGYYISSPTGEVSDDKKREIKGVREALTLQGTFFASSGRGTYMDPFILEK